MASEPGLKAAEERIQRAIHRIREEIPSAKPLADAYEKLLLERARFKAELPQPADVHVPTPHAFSFLRGAPLLTEETFVPFMVFFKHPPDRILLGLGNIFPKIKPDLARLKTALDSGQLRLERCLEFISRRQNERVEEIALRLEIEPLTLNIILGQVVKPFIEKLAESFSTPLQGLVWRKGYCPFCGSFPELSALKGAEGQRWLRCALCGHEWRFTRMVCPFCENSDHKRMGFSYIEDRPYEGIEICDRCRRYLLSIDLRRGGEGDVLDTIATGLLHLEILAQQEGFLPMALYPWNFAVQNDISTEMYPHPPEFN